MYNVTLVGTIHYENGQCNPDRLCNILKEIEPDVIFEELSIRFAEMFYSEEFDIAYEKNILLNRPMPELFLEVRSVKKYRQDHTVDIIPVDIETEKNVTDEIDKILNENFSRYEKYRSMSHEIGVFVENEGFYFLNSMRFTDILDKKKILEREILDLECDNQILHTNYRNFLELIDNHENAMLQNIYEYSKENPYRQAVFLIGAAHRKSIMAKIMEYQEKAGIKLNWTMYGDL